MKRLINHLLALIPAVIVFILIMAEPFFGADAALCDVIYSRMNGMGDTIKLIRIDEETLAEYGILGSWSRAKSAELIEYLYEDPETSPKVLAFDLMFIGDSDPEADNALSEAAKKADHLVVASNLVYRGKMQYASDGAPYYDVMNIDTEERPYEKLESRLAKMPNTFVSEKKAEHLCAAVKEFLDSLTA